MMTICDEKSIAYSTSDITYSSIENTTSNLATI